MANLTVELQVNALEFEVFMEVAGVLPPAFVMALRAVRSVRAPVRILVAGRTALRGDLGELELAFEVLRSLSETFLRGNVTLIASNLLVFALQFEAGLIVIELLQFLEAIRRMAADTRPVVELRTEHVLVLVHVAALAETAFLAWEHENTTLVRRLAENDVLRRFMTFITVLRDLLVITRQLKASVIVVEGQLLIETDRSMATRAGLLQSLFIELLLMRRHVAVRAKLRILALLEAE